MLDDIKSMIFYIKNSFTTARKNKDIKIISNNPKPKEMIRIQSYTNGRDGQQIFADWEFDKLANSQFFDEFIEILDRMDKDVDDQLEMKKVEERRLLYNELKEEFE